MTDFKVFKPVAATFTATSAAAGAFPPPVGIGAPVSIAASPVGILFTVMASADGSEVLTIEQDEEPAPTNPTGMFVVAQYKAILPTYADGDASVLHVTANGELLTSDTSFRGPDTSSVTSVAASAASVTLLALNADRRGATIFNDSAVANLFLKLGATASLTSFTVKMGPNSFYELTFPTYTGVIDGIWDVAVGSARVTELTI